MHDYQGNEATELFKKENKIRFGAFGKSLVKTETLKKLNKEICHKLAWDTQARRKMHKKYIKK